MDVVIAIDSGTTATKAVAVARDTDVIAVASAGYSLLVPEPNRAELDAARVREAAVEALLALCRKLPDDVHVVGICLSAAMHGLVPMTPSGEPLGDLWTWADSRATDEALELARTHPQLHARTGTPIHPMSPLVKLNWLRRHDPKLLRETPRWGGVKELLIASLCETELTIDLSCASATGMYDIHERRWDPEALEVAGVSESQLAEVVATTDVVGKLRPDIAQAAGLPQVPIVAGASDGPLGNLGLGAISPGVAAINLGTSGAMRAISSRPAVDEAGRLFCYALTDDRWVLGGPINNAGSVVRWASGVIGSVPLDVEDPAVWNESDVALLDEALKAPAGSEGLLCLPYLLGERAPWWTPGLAGAWIGLRRDHHRGHLVRSAVEGVCQQFAFIRDALEAAGVDLVQIRVTGGAAQSQVWQQSLAAALGSSINLAESPEGSAVGAGLLGHYALGSLDSLDEVVAMVGAETQIDPDPQAVEVLRKMRPLLATCTQNLVGVFAELDDISDIAGNRMI